MVRAWPLDSTSAFHEFDQDSESDVYVRFLRGETLSSGEDQEFKTNTRLSGHGETRLLRKRTEVWKLTSQDEDEAVQLFADLP